MKFQSKCKWVVAAVVAGGILNTASAQLVKVVDEPYPLPTVVTTPSQVHLDKPKTLVVPAPAVVNTVPEAKVEVVAPAPTLNYLVPGKTVAVQLQQMAQASGWQLVWEAADFAVDQRIALGVDFIKSITSLVESANANGTNIKATFFRGNNIVRVTEY